MLDEIVPVIQNVRRTIAWFEQHGRLPPCVIIDRLPEDMQDLQTYVRELDAWLQKFAESELLTDTPKHPEPSPKSGFLDLLVDTKH